MRKVQAENKEVLADCVSSRLRSSPLFIYSDVCLGSLKFLCVQSEKEELVAE